MYFTRKPGGLTFGRSSCLPDKTRKGATVFISDSVELESFKND